LRKFSIFSFFHYFFSAKRKLISLFLQNISSKSPKGQWTTSWKEIFWLTLIMAIKFPRDVALLFDEICLLKKVQIPRDVSCAAERRTFF